MKTHNEFIEEVKEASREPEIYEKTNEVFGGNHPKCKKELNNTEINSEKENE